MTDSLRFKLLLWHAVVLGGLLLCGAGWMLWNLQRVVLQEIDGRLRVVAIELRNVLTPDEEGKFSVDLTENLIRKFDWAGKQGPYYCIWNQSGELVDVSHPDSQIPPMSKEGTRNRANLRELTVAGPQGSWVLVGQNAASEWERLRALATQVGLATLAALGLLLAGSWFLTERALWPITRISQAAAAISATNRAERIDVAAMESELAELALTINGAFDRLGEAVERQSRFTSHASHELRTPLAIIRANTDFALSRERPVAEYRGALDSVRRATVRMEAIVSGLLTLARAEAGRVTLEQEPVELDEVVRETCTLCEPLAEQRQIQLTVKTERVFVLGDCHRLGEAVANLVSNAVLYNREGGAVEVVVRTTETLALVEVRDTGPGIPAADLPRLFEPFYRVRERATDHAAGSGLGLAICEWIAAAHGGTVTAANQLSGGSVFELRLPLLAKSSARRNAASQSSHSSAQQNSKASL